MSTANLFDYFSKPLGIIKVPKANLHSPSHLWEVSQSNYCSQFFPLFGQITHSKFQFDPEYGYCSFLGIWTFWRSLKSCTIMFKFNVGMKPFINLICFSYYNIIECLVQRWRLQCKATEQSERGGNSNETQSYSNAFVLTTQCQQSQRGKEEENNRRCKHNW